MRLIPSDPDIRTIVGRIDGKQIDLQPQFQRGAVWSVSKRQRLVDSVLRNWHVPPIHLVETKLGKLEVLDGQQRLRSIHDFVNDRFAVDGNIAPQSDDILSLDGAFYSELPEFWKNRFDQFAIRQFVLVDYEASEPYELFFRLNQTVSLTPSEQRNAFYGAARNQVKDLTRYLQECGFSKETIGFGNSRMAYEDVVARTAFTLNARSLAVRVASDALSEVFRSGSAFPNRVDRLLRRAIFLASRAISAGPGVRLNKATLYSWLLVYARIASHSGELKPLIAYDLMVFLSSRPEGVDSHLFHAVDNDLVFSNVLRRTFLDRATARVANVSSVLLRDAIIWQFLPIELVPPPLRIKVKELKGRFNEIIGTYRDLDASVVDAVTSMGWELI